MRFYTRHALAPATRKTYNAGEKHYFSFCQSHDRQPLPASELQLAEFITYLADIARIAPATIKIYMAAVRSLHIECGHKDPFEGTTLPHRVFTGVKRIRGVTSYLVRLPITLTILHRLIAQVRRSSWLSRIEQLMIGTACSLCFFGFLRSGELIRLERSDITTAAEPSKHLKVHLRASKTDPFRQGCTLSVGCTNPTSTPICAVCLMYTYLKATQHRPSKNLFSWDGGQALDKARFVNTVQRLLKESGCPNYESYKGHSFRSGAATSAAEMGVPDWLIKCMGRWASDAYQTYIKTPLVAVLHASRAISTSTT